MADKKEVVVGANITPEDVKKHLQMFTTVLQSVMSWLPATESTAKIKKVGDLLVAIAAQEWFVGLIVYLLNTFHNEPVTQESLGQALSFYGKKVEGGEKPVVFDLK